MNNPWGINVHLLKSMEEAWAINRKRVDNELNIYGTCMEYPRQSVENGWRMHGKSMEIIRPMRHWGPLALERMRPGAHGLCVYRPEAHGPKPMGSGAEGALGPCVLGRWALVHESTYGSANTKTLAGKPWVSSIH